MERGRRLNPSALGPLTEALAIDTGTAVLFPGEEALLSRRAIRHKRKLLDAIEPMLARVLAPGEQVLWVARGQQTPRVLDWLGLGLLFSSFHPVTLVLTDRQLLEVLMDIRQRAPVTRWRSFPWAGSPRLRRGLGKLAVHDPSGIRVSWRIAASHDRKLLKRLLPHVERRIEEAASAPPHGSGHRWLCPMCGAGLSPDPTACDGCGTAFRSRKLAALLSLAFPGVGLFYARRPVLGTFDLLAELVLFGVFAFALATAAVPGEAVPLTVAGAVALVVTKLESVHLSDILVRRALPVKPARGALWRRLAWGGGAASVGALAVALAATGTIAVPGGTIVRDLELSATDGWQGTRDATEFSWEDDGTQRSEWLHPSGTRIGVFAYESELDPFRSELLRSLRASGMEPEVDRLPGGREGFRTLVAYDTPDGRLVDVSYSVWDEESRVVHQLIAPVPAGELDATLPELDAMFERTAWVARPAD